MVTLSTWKGVNRFHKNQLRRVIKTIKNTDIKKAKKMTNIIKKVTDAYNTALSSIEREKKIQELTSSLGNKLTATQRAVIAKDLAELVAERKSQAKSILSKFL